eukprot:422668_1
MPFRIKAVSRQLKLFDDWTDLIERSSLSDIRKSLCMTFRIIQNLDLKTRTLDLKIMACAIWGLRLCLGGVPWKESMRQWTPSYWAYFILEILSILKISNPNITVIPTYKIQSHVVHQQYDAFIRQIHKCSSDLISKNSKYSRYRYKPNANKSRLMICGGNMGDMQQDIALSFRAMLEDDRFVMDNLMMAEVNNVAKAISPTIPYPTNTLSAQQIFSSLRDTYCKAYGYHIVHTQYVLDSKGNVFNGFYLYIKKCFDDALKSQPKRQQKKRRYAYEYCLNFCFDLLCLPVDGEKYWEHKRDRDGGITDWKATSVFIEYTVPRRWRAMRKKYGMVIPIKYSKKCDVCGVVEGSMHIIDIKNPDVKRVKKIYNCPCKAFYVCGRRCQKIGWNHEKFRHRDQCSIVNNEDVS